MREQKKKELGSEKIGKLLFKLSAPATIGMMVNSLYNLVDAIFIGQGVGTLALGGLAIAFPIQMLLMSIAMAVGVGSSSIISRALGAGDDKKAELAQGNSVAMILVLSFFVTIAGLIWLEPILLLFGATENILPYAYDYTFVIMAGTVFYGFVISQNHNIRAEGSAKHAMVSMIIGTGLNLILDPVFIFVFKMGIRGAAIATVIALFFACVYVMVYHWRGWGVLKFRLRDIRLDFTQIPEVLKLGSSSLARTMAGSILAVILYRSLGYYGDDHHLAIMGILNRLMMFLFMPMFGVVQGLQPILGFNYGARKLSRVRGALNLSIKVLSFYSVAVFALLMFVPQMLMAMFSRDPQIISMAANIVRVIAIGYPLVGFQIVGASLFQAIGKAKPALILSSSRQILFLIPLIVLLPLYFGLEGVWFAYPAADILSTLVTAAWVVKETVLLKKQELDLAVEG